MVLGSNGVVRAGGQINPPAGRRDLLLDALRREHGAFRYDIADELMRGR
jgi:hypothetical protein